MPACPETVAAYAAELADEGKSMSTVRLAVASIVDAHRRVGLDSAVTVGVSEILGAWRDRSASVRNRRSRLMPIHWRRSGRPRSCPEDHGAVRWSRKRPP